MIKKLKRETISGLQTARRSCAGRAGFTLVELLAVVVVILVLASIMVGVTGYVQKSMAISTTRAQLAAIQAALEMYKADWGFYPPTGPGRISNTGVKESSNNATLFFALSPANSSGNTNCATTNCIYTIVRQGRKTYLRFPAAQIQTNSTTALPNICDPWGTPFNYYCSPNTPYAVLNNYPDPVTGTNTGYAAGGQVNGLTYDLFSYGPDRLTYVPGAVYANGNFSGWYKAKWTAHSSANDDIGNFKQ